MEKIEKLKIGNYVLTFDNFFRKSINYCGVDVIIDHCSGSKTFKNIDDYERFCCYLNNNWYPHSRYMVHSSDFVIFLSHDADTLTISYEMHNTRELSYEYDEIMENVEHINWVE